jgi:hypothetical protein
MTNNISLLLLAVAFVLVHHPFFVSSTAEDDFFPPIAEPSDISYFFADYDLDGLHWALKNIFVRSARNPTVLEKELPQELVSRGGGQTYTSEYKLKHDLAQAKYLADYLVDVDPKKAAYFQSKVIPIYEAVLKNIPPLDELENTKGLYAFSKEDYSLGIGEVYNKALYMTSADELDPSWRQNELLNERLDLDLIQKQWNGDDSGLLGEADSSPDQSPSSVPGVIVIDNLLDEQALTLIRELLLKNTWWFQTKTPLQFGRYVGAYIDDGMHDPLLLQLALELHKKLPKIMMGHELRYMWAYKYSSEFYSGINLHADEAAVNVNIWLSLEGADLEEDGYLGGLVVYTAKPKKEWNFKDYNTRADELVVKELLEPSNFANVTVKHKPNRCIIFDSALFHQTQKYKFKTGYQNSRINLTLLYGKMKKDGSESQTDSSSITEKEEL